MTGHFDFKPGLSRNGGSMFASFCKPKDHSPNVALNSTQALWIDSLPPCCRATQTAVVGRPSSAQSNLRRVSILIPLD